ncbi:MULTISPECIES: putative leader peptide [unclassified Rhodococcus (in: high G+C Gram-positive bacteria)]|uniref:putative leader peptide n=1 Tax=unclassified Rhodococcus (in: high G+C Gram-positive bacteria) TaxID=192944 RepID=UPI0034A0C39A
MCRRPRTSSRRSRPSSHPGIQFPEKPGTLHHVYANHELMLTRRRAVDLCRLGGCCCPCC